MAYITDTQLIVAKLKSGSMDLLSKALNDLMAEHEERVKVTRLMRKFYEGEPEIKSKDKTGTRPDKRLVFNFAKKVVWYATNYILGKSPVYKPELSMDDSEFNQASEFFNLVLDIHKEAGEASLLKKILKYLLIDGQAWELVYIDQEGQICSMYIPDSEFIPVYNGSKMCDLDFGIRYWTETVQDGTDNTKEQVRVELYDQTMVTNYIKVDNGTFVLDTDKPPYPHFMDEVPICGYHHPDEDSDLADIMTLNDDYNEHRSGRSGDLSYSANSYLWLHNAFFGSQASEGKTQAELEREVDDMLTRKILQTFDGVTHHPTSGEPVILKALVQFITKELQTEALSEHLKDLRKGIHEFTFTPDIDADKSISNVAETTLKLMFMPADMKADALEPCLKEGIRKRFRLYSQLLYRKTGKQYKPSWVGVTFRRNRIINEQELLGNLSNAYRGKILDQQTAVELNPYVEDPELVMERLEEDAKKEAERLNTDWGLTDHEDDEE